MAKLLTSKYIKYNGPDFIFGVECGFKHGYDAATEEAKERERVLVKEIEKLKKQIELLEDSIQSEICGYDPR